MDGGHVSPDQEQNVIAAGSSGERGEDALQPGSHFVDHGRESWIVNHREHRPRVDRGNGACAMFVLGDHDIAWKQRADRRIQ